jgi:hypothetical protein
MWDDRMTEREIVMSNDNGSDPAEQPDSVFDNLASAMDGESEQAMAYRRDLCLILAGKVKSEFGIEGLCELIGGIDIAAGWISDILLESGDIDNHLFSEYGVYMENSIDLARKTESMKKFQRSLWSTRRRYAKMMAEEIYAASIRKTV